MGMKQFFLILLFALQVFADGQREISSEMPNEIRLGFIPSGDREVLKRASLIIAKQLQEEISIPVNVYISKDYSSLIQAMKQGKVDFAFFSSAMFVAAERDTKVQVLLKKIWIEPFYFSVLLTKKNSKIKKIDDLKGKKIAFVDLKSTSGYLYPQVMLKKKGWSDQNFAEVKFSGSHAGSVQLLESGAVDAIAVFSDDKAAKKSAWTKFSKKDKGGKDIRILWLSEPIPNDPFCVRSDFYEKYPKLTHNLMFSLIDVYEKLKKNKDVTDIIGAQGFLPATSRQYDPVREMVKELGLRAE